MYCSSMPWKNCTSLSHVAHGKKVKTDLRHALKIVNHLLTGCLDAAVSNVSRRVGIYIGDQGGERWAAL